MAISPCAVGETQRPIRPSNQRAPAMHSPMGPSKVGRLAAVVEEFIRQTVGRTSISGRSSDLLVQLSH